MEDPEIGLTLGLIMKLWFFGIYEDCLIFLRELCLKVKCKKGINSLNQVHPLMFYLGNDTFRLMSHKFIKINSPQGLYIIKRLELKRIIIDAKSRMIDAILALLEEHPPTDPAILDQVNNMRGGAKT